MRWSPVGRSSAARFSFSSSVCVRWRSCSRSSSLLPSRSISERRSFFSSSQASMSARSFFISDSVPSIVDCRSSAICCSLHTSCWDSISFFCRSATSDMAVAAVTVSWSLEPLPRVLPLVVMVCESDKDQHDGSSLRVLAVLVLVLVVVVLLLLLLFGLVLVVLVFFFFLGLLLLVLVLVLLLFLLLLGRTTRRNGLADVPLLLLLSRSRSRSRPRLLPWQISCCYCCWLGIGCCHVFSFWH
mmetsp:Transcript_7434/g.21641  ORF Transcript_7434/g.21641 Transcript_7434/m.21641 type:complete len:242 (+) Transcript_7434:1927-2652(+)